MKAIENIKKNFIPESQKSGMVILGLVAGKVAGKLIDMLIEKYPNIESWAKIVKPIAIGGGGLIIASIMEKDSKVKYIGYGVAGAGVLEGIKLIPVAGEFLSGLEETPPSAYYTENEFGKLELGSFGLAALPVQNMSLQEASTFTPELPDLEGITEAGNTYEEISGSDLGYNPSQTEDTDIHGIL